jgi:hypothetical protein
VETSVGQLPSFGGFKLQDLGRKNQIRRIRSEFWNQFQFNSNKHMELAGFLVPFRVEPQPRLLKKKIEPGANQQLNSSSSPI